MIAIGAGPTVLEFRNSTQETYLRRFPFNQNFGKCRNGDKWYGKLQGKVPENPEIVDFSKDELFNRKFRKKLKWNGNSRQE